MSTKVYNEYEQEHKIWDIHHSLASPIYGVRKALIMKLLPKFKKNILCLDAGCGTGEYTVELLKRGFSVHSFDLSEYAINKLKCQLPVRYKSMFKGTVLDIVQFTSEEKYDFILISEVLEHIKNDLAVLKKMYNLLKPNGKILITVPFDPKLWTESDTISMHERRYTKLQIRELVKEADLSIDKFWIYGFLILRIWVLFRKRFLTRSAIIKNTGKLENMTKYKHLIALMEYLEKLVLFFDTYYLSTSKGVGVILLCKKSSNK